MGENSTTRDGSDFLKTGRGKTRSASIEVPSISLPGGGGAIKDIDEKFTVNVVNGTSSFSIPLLVSSARGITPNLSLSYDSGAGNGNAGLGWSITAGSVKRKTNKGFPRYLDNITDPDTFLLSGAEDLVPEYKKGDDGRFTTGPEGKFILNECPLADGMSIIRSYRQRIEESFAKIERLQSKTGNEIKWKVTTRENEVTLLGWNTGSRIADPAKSGRIFEWLPDSLLEKA